MGFVRNTVAFLILCVGAFVLLALNPRTALIAAAVLFALGYISIYGSAHWPWFKSRVLAALAMGLVAVPAAVMASLLLLFDAQERHETTRTANPADYLASLKDTNPDRWFRELEKLDPAAFAAETRRRELEERAENERAACGSAANTLAHIYAQGFVEQQLAAPTTARFPSIHREGVRVTPVGNCEFLVQAYVDAQNGFGAMIRTPYAIQLKRLPHQEAWELVNLRIGD